VKLQSRIKPVTLRVVDWIRIANCDLFEQPNAD